MPEGAPDEKHLRVRFRFTDGGPELRFVDQRTFGGLALADLVRPDGDLLPSTVAHIARDPMDPAFDPVTGELKPGCKPSDKSRIPDHGDVYATALYLSDIDSSGHGRNERPPLTYIKKG